MMDSVFSQVRKIAAEVFEVGDDDIVPESSPQTVGNWDSIQHLNLVLALEAKFHIEFSAEEMESIRSIGDAARIVEQKETYTHHAGQRNKGES